MVFDAVSFAVATAAGRIKWKFECKQGVEDGETDIFIICCFDVVTSESNFAASYTQQCGEDLPLRPALTMI